MTPDFRTARVRGGLFKKLLSLLLLALLLAAANLVYPLVQRTPETGGTAVSDNTVVHFIDVGQGDSELIQSGSDAVLIDGGPADAADSVVAYLKKAGVTRLRAVIATHPHADHIGGLPAVLKNFPAEVIYMPNCTLTTESFGDLLDTIERYHIQTVVPTPGETLTFSTGATLRFLYPSPDAVYKDLNNYSIVSMLTAGSTRILFMGDAQTQAEQVLLREKADLSCDVLKVGHHGSYTASSPAFLRQLGAKTAIISCGAGNSYGFPHAVTIRHLKNAGIGDIRRTDLQGTIVITLPASTSANQKKEAFAA